MQVEETDWALRYGELCDGWNGATAPSSDMVARTHEAISAIRPADLAAIEPLVRSLNARCEQSQADGAARAALLAFLDVVRRRRFLCDVSAGLADPWSELIVTAIESANFTVPELLASRERTDPAVVALRVLGEGACEVTVAELARRTRAIARGLLAMLEQSGKPDGLVALLSENSLDSALCDLAALTNGIVNVRVPANAVASDIEYILRHSEARVLIVSGEEQLLKVMPSLPSLPDLHAVIVMARGTAERRGMLSLDQLVAQGGDVDDQARARRASAVRTGDLASVMYTSGTTGLPKAIMFSHLNIVSKRFCRALALPSIGEGDVLLCYLPLYHTFGRWLELMGTLFWGATYVIARDPSQTSLLEDFSSVRPTVFISVPTKWLELHERAIKQVGSEDPGLVAQRIRQLTGGAMRQGLSAAGYLDPQVFRSMHKAGIDLCSGYGMTEATGGITMTPSRDYRDGSIGKALPGIELRVADDGELLIRGPYVMMGYLRPEDGSSGLDEHGWFSTGDIVTLNDDGHCRLVDRKKEIYKNRKGQTIVPQRIENLFRDFDVVGQVFLVGDHLDYNTLLIWPNYDAHPELREQSSSAVRDLLSSLVVSANRFLARYERIVAFELLPRPLSEEHGELTPKGTFKRQVVREQWRELIEPMYRERSATFDVSGLPLLIPNWVLRDIGVLRVNLTFCDGKLRALDRALTLERDPDNSAALRIGDAWYETSEGAFDLGALLSDPRVWLGNDELRVFLGDEAFYAIAGRRSERRNRIRHAARATMAPSGARARVLVGDIAHNEATIESVHAAAALLALGGADALAAVRHLRHGLGQTFSNVSDLCRAILRRTARLPDGEVVRASLLALLAGESVDELLPTLTSFLATRGLELLRDEELEAVAEAGLPDRHVQVLVDSLSAQARLNGNGAMAAEDRNTLCGLLRIVASYAVGQPSWFARARYPLARLTMHPEPNVAAHAGEQLDRLQLGFRVRIGTNIRLAVDPETAQEYGWHEVVVFDENVPDRHRKLILRAVTETTLVRESVFLFGRGVLLNLADIPPRSLWISHLGTKHGKSVYRLSIQTRIRGAFDVALNVAESVPVGDLREEIRWLMAAGDDPPLVELFGGYFPEYGIFTEEYIPGETVEHQVGRLLRLGAEDRLRALWPFLVWSALGAHVEFWDRTGRVLALDRPEPSNVIIPSHDYHLGARLVSISERTVCTTFETLLGRFEKAFLDPMLEQVPLLRGSSSPVILLSAVVQTLGLERGLELLGGAVQGAYGDWVRSFLEEVRARGFTPKRVYFAGRRYQRWIALNPDATVEARGDMLQELWDTYRLDEEEQQFPDARVRFFRGTVFKTARDEIVVGLERWMARARQGAMDDDALREQVVALRATAKPNAEEDYFLARLAYRHLRPSDDASIISLPSGNVRVTDVMVSLHDAEGMRFRVRGPVSARDVGKLLGLFHEANLA
ncbi:MAG: AMP-binding protein, partial [Polyangiaceae bacterium]|nr:AMP-binding protein [Polyangiaceae bacterium]